MTPARESCLAGIAKEPIEELGEEDEERQEEDGAKDDA